MGWNLTAAPLLALLFGASPCSSLDPSAQEPDRAKWLKETKFSLSEAIDKGVAEAKGGVPHHAELELDKGKIVYSIDVAQGDKNVAVVLDSKTGAALENDTEDEDHSQLVKAAKISLKQAIESSLASVKGAAIEAQLVLQAKRPVVQVRVLADGAVRIVAIDAETGKTIGPETGKATAAASAPKEPAAETEKQFTDRFDVDARDLAPAGTNPFFPLEPGYKLVLEGKDKGKHVVLRVSVLDETRKVDGVETRVVEEHESADGQVVEISRNYWAISTKTATIYYFGEDVDMYRDGKVVSHDGAWLSGVNGAKFGILLPGTPLVGGRYYQEIAPAVAMDRAEIVSLEEKFQCPAGTFERCLKTEETTPLEPGAKEYKIYAPGVGLVTDGELKLTRYGKDK